MKKYFLFLFILVSHLVTNAQTEETPTINWMTFNEALAAQKVTPKKIMMDVYTNWCGPCKLMDKKTFSNTDVINYINENFYAVKFNAEGPGKIKYDNQTFTNPRYDPKKKNSKNSTHQLTDYLQVRGFPTLLFFEEDGGLLAPIPGYSTVKKLEMYLKLFFTNKYKEISTAKAFEKYQKEFVYEFTEE